MRPDSRSAYEPRHPFLPASVRPRQTCHADAGPSVRLSVLTSSPADPSAAAHRDDRRAPHAASERRLDEAQRCQDDSENDQRGTHPSRSSDAGETTRTPEGIASVRAGAPTSTGAEPSEHTTMALVPSCPEGCINFSGERLGLSAYRAWKSDRNGLRAYETLGARLLSPSRSLLSSNLSMNWSIPPIVTDSTHKAKFATRAPLTVLAPSRMVALGDQGECMMDSVRRDTPRATSAAIRRGCEQ